MEYGLLLPHFGHHTDRDMLWQGARRAEELGFDSLWVRDHLMFEPHGEFEAPNRNFLEPLTVLTSVGSVTSSVKLGTATLIPYRHPLVVAATLTSIDSVVGGGRLITAWGAGGYDFEFEAVGMGGIFRPELVESNARILAKVLSEDHVNYEDKHYRFDNVTIRPRPAAPIPFWYGGATPASARRAATYCSGWMPGRITLPTIAKRVTQMSRLTEENGRPIPTVACIPPTSIGETTEEAMEGTSLEGLLAWANSRGKWWVKPASGRFETAEDIEGSLIAGTPDEVVAATVKFADVGVDHLVYDLRLSFDRWLQSIELLGKEVLPRLR